MFKIYRLETDTLYDDLFKTYNEALEMIGYFIADDMESPTEPDYSYGVVDAKGKLLCAVRYNTYVDLKYMNCKI